MSKTLTILSSSASLPDDIRKYGIVGDVMAVGRVIIDYHHPIKYAVCLHKDILDLYMQYRKVIHLNTDDVDAYHELVDWPLSINTSGLLALCIATKLGYDDIRVLGLSADSSGHYYDLPSTGVVDFDCRFPDDNEDWIPILKSWTNVKVGSGNLLRLFNKLDEVYTDVF